MTLITNFLQGAWEIYTKNVKNRSKPWRLFLVLTNYTPKRSWHFFRNRFLNANGWFTPGQRQSAFLRVCILLPFFTYTTVICLQWGARMNVPYWAHFLCTLACIIAVPIYRMGNDIPFFNETDTFWVLRRRNFLETYLHYCKGFTEAIARTLVFCTLIFSFSLYIRQSESLNEEGGNIFLKKFFIWVTLTVFFTIITTSLDLISERRESWLSKTAQKKCPRPSDARYWVVFSPKSDEEKLTPVCFLYPYCVFYYWVQFICISWEYKCALIAATIVILHP